MSGRTIITIAMVIFLLHGISGCSKKPEQKPLSPSLKIAVSFADKERDGNKIIRKVMEQRKKDADVIWLDARNNHELQEKQLEKLLKDQKRIRAIIFQAVDPVKSGKLVERLARKNIKLVALETLPLNAPVDIYVASDHTRTGQLLSRFITNASSHTNRPLNVLILKGDPADQASNNIAATAKAVLQDKRQIQIVEETNHAKGDPNLAVLTTQQALKKYNNQIDVIVATDSRLAMAAVKVLREKGLADRVLTAGVGTDKEASQALAKGEHDAEVDPMPELLAQYSLDAALNLAREGRWQYDTLVANGDYNIPARMVPVRLIQHSNLYLLEQRWGKLTKDEKSPERQSNEENEKEGKDKKSPEKPEERKKTKLRVITQDGKTVEIEIPGEVKCIETEAGQKESQ